MIAMLVLLMLDYSLPARNAMPGDLDGSLNLSAGTESRSMEGSPNFSDTFYLFSPSLLAMSNHSSRTRLSASYTPEFEMFGEHRELNSWNHSASLGVSRNFSPRFSLSMGDSFLSTTDPSRQLANSFLLLPPSRYQENAFYVRTDHNLRPRTMLSFDFSNSVIRYGLAAEFRKGFLDQMGNAWTTTVSRKLTEGEKISVSYTLLKLTILDSPGLSANAGSVATSLTHYFTVGYLNSGRPDLTVGVTAGLIRTADFSYALSGQIRKQMGAMWFDAEYNRTLSFFGGQSFGSPVSSPLGSGLLASNRYEMVTLGMSGDMGKRVGLNLRVTGSRTGSGPAALTSRSLIGSLSLDYRITGHITLYSVAEFYHQNLNRFPGAPTSRHRFYIGIKLNLRERRTAPGAVYQASSASLPIQTSGN
jgi:hypothetical protein